MRFALMAVAAVCLLPAFCADAVALTSIENSYANQFDYEIVIPKPLIHPRSTYTPLSTSFSQLPDWKSHPSKRLTSISVENGFISSNDKHYRRKRSFDNTTFVTSSSSSSFSFLNKTSRYRIHKRKLMPPFSSSLQRKSNTKVPTTTITSNYRIHGFNQTFDLLLINDDSFISPNFVIQYFDTNRTWITRDIARCYYSGLVNHDPDSKVTLSLCKGMRGSFLYHDTEYYIEPKRNKNETRWNFEHLLYTHNDHQQSDVVRCPVHGKPYFERSDRRKRRRKKVFYSTNNKSLPYSNTSINLTVNDTLSNDIEDDFSQRSILKSRTNSIAISSTFNESPLYDYRSHRKKRNDPDPLAKHVEVFVAYDDNFEKFHSDTDITSYILTLFSYVSHLYSDASIGNNIKIWLVKLMKVNDLTFGGDAADILNRFCKWQKDQNSPINFDVAVLLTRVTLCHKRTKSETDNKCDTLGLTELGTMCNTSSSCAVVRDNGFATAFTIAHELAHLFGVRHDNDKACQDHTKEQNIMATSLTFNHNHYKWSNCSRHFFSQYLESERYQCLNNIPDKNSQTFKDLNGEQTARELPGSFNDKDKQCKRAFGTNYEYCSNLNHGAPCARLFCKDMYANGTSCMTNHAPWSDGTECHEQWTEPKRCFRGECRSNHDLRSRNGNWGEWSPWSACTRTCGSAVQKSHRTCDNPKPENGGQYCSGQSNRIQSCEHNLPCKDPIDMFRQRQCSKFNNRSIDPSLPIGVRFEPKYNVLPSERCKLICKVSDDRLERSFVLGDRVEDGTPCGREEETRDICISGVCMPVGCDNKYGSNATEDVCGVCNGRNRTCRLLSGTKVVAGFGLTSIVDIPVNATRVIVTQISNANDLYYLAVKYVNGTYILNGMHSLQLYNVKIRVGAALLHYTGSDSDNETIQIYGRLRVPLEIQVLSIHAAGAAPTYVHWEYYAPKDETLINGENFEQEGQFGSEHHCDRPCQGWKPVRKCVINGGTYNPSYCSTYRIPFTTQKESCNNDCVLSWTAKHQHPCSTRCGDGYKRVIYECAKTSFTERTMEVLDETICKQYVGTKPTDIVPCSGDCTGTGWVYSNWKDCHHSPNQGCIRERTSECRNSSFHLVSTYYCVSEFLLHAERCAESACQSFRWNYTTWSDCDCQSRRRRRNVSCVKNGNIVKEQYCNQESKPDESTSCYQECLMPQWITDEWQKCTATCSTGVRNRRVTCSHHGSIVSDQYCDRRTKPTDQESCSTNLSCPNWNVGKWYPCSVTCGMGVQQRQVFCTQDDRQVDRAKCEVPMPDEQQQCKLNACSTTKWNVGVWGECSQTCGLGMQQRAVYCEDPSMPWKQLLPSECSINDKPLHIQNCTITACPVWEIDKWTKCVGVCGSANRTRSVWCSHNQRELNDSYCLRSEPKPKTTEPCSRQTYCPQWVTSSWSECFGSMCEPGVQYRQVVCRNEHEIISKTNCNEHDRPLSKQSCYLWNTSCSTLRTGELTRDAYGDVKSWEECSVICGVGQKIRKIYCLNGLTKAVQDDRHCSRLLKKSVDFETCETTGPCESYHWKTTEWTRCPVTCGQSIQQRSLMCTNDRGMAVSHEKCNGLDRPPNVTECRRAPCIESQTSLTWIMSTWEPCDDQKCLQTRSVHCMDVLTGRHLPAWSCTQKRPEPPANRTCPTSACLQWKVTRWNGCSVKCGRGIELGFGLTCYTKISPHKKLDASECEAVPLPKPISRRTCTRNCFAWETSSWSECDAKCGDGKRTRKLSCIKLPRRRSAHNRFCKNRRRNLTKPTTEESCNVQSCYQWMQTDRWTHCTVSCNGGIEHNYPDCVHIYQNNVSVDEKFCNLTTKPNYQRICNAFSCPTTTLPTPPYHRPYTRFNVSSSSIGRFPRRRRIGRFRMNNTWETELWSPCNVRCGVGEQHRIVRCLNFNRTRTLDDRFCRHIPQPSRTQQCFQQYCIPTWVTGNWSTCTATCGYGMQYRSVLCHAVDNDGHVLKSNISMNCNRYNQPLDRIPCNLGDCQSPYLWHIEPWSTCSSDCGIGEQKRIVLCRHQISRTPVSDYYCDIQNKPLTNLKCFGLSFEYDRSTKRLC